MQRFVFAAAATASLVLSAAVAARAQTAPDPMASLHFLAGHWSCTSVADGKKSVYTTDWAAAPGGRWMRGTNRSGASQSEDILGYDATQNAGGPSIWSRTAACRSSSHRWTRIRRTCRRNRFTRTTRKASGTRSAPIRRTCWRSTFSGMGNTPAGKTTAPVPNRAVREDSINGQKNGAL